MKSTRSPALSARAAACRAIAEALAGGMYVSDHIRRLRTQQRLDPRDAALATEIGLGAVRHAITIRHVLTSVARYDDRRVKPELRAILYAAAYQLIWLDRVPDFAAVDEAVNLARQLSNARAAGMVNAVLRVLTRSIESRRVEWQHGSASQVRVNWSKACAFQHDVLPAPGGSAGPASHVAAAAAERVERFRELTGRFGVRKAESTAWASQATPAMVIYRNPLRTTPIVFRRLISAAAAGIADPNATHTEDDVAYVSPTVSLADSVLLSDGLAHIQDTTASAAGKLVQARPGERVLDLCAAPGGKSIVLAQDMHDRGELIACDVSADRLQLVTQNAARMHLTCVRTQAIAADGELPGLAALDAALVDAPCSNTGVIARRPEARFRLTHDALRSLAKSQARLIRRAAAVVRPGGRLVYSTCSIEPSENEGIITAFVRENPQWRLDDSILTLPKWGPSPGDWRDGGFAARLSCRT